MGVCKARRASGCTFRVVSSSILLTILGIGCASGVGGCTSSQDVSNDPPYQVGYVPGQVYRLECKAAIIKPNSDPEHCGLDADDPPTISRYSDATVMAILPPGDRIRIDRLLHVTVTAPIQGESYVEVFITPLDHPCSCKSLRLGGSLSGAKVVHTPDGWPTMIESPKAAYLTLEPPSR